MRLAFMGTPAFAVPSLRALIAAGHRVLAVYCQPPRPSGRGHSVQASPVQQAAAASGLPIRHPRTLRDAGEAAAFAALDLDAAIVAAYGLILPKAVLAAPRLGCLNIHASLLPRWRGAAPIQRAILAGDAETGVTIMQMDEGLDTGPILLARSVPIGPMTTAATLHEALASLGADLALAALEGCATGRLAARPQPEEGVTYAAKLRREEAELDWRQPAAALERRVRAFDPWPGTSFAAAGERIKVLAAEVASVSASAAPGTILDDRLAIACATGALRPTLLQRAGRAPADVAAFLRGFPLPPGTRLTCPATS
ncbi:MAG: methionyl-tRNA formyltransferase [Alphaproteobacteria bacterium]|nr:methionyl-tRNA formyltransferase [Alphaproteobacteria bacterium]